MGFESVCFILSELEAPGRSLVSFFIGGGSFTERDPGVVFGLVFSNEAAALGALAAGLLGDALLAELAKGLTLRGRGSSSKKSSSSSSSESVM